MRTMISIKCPEALVARLAATADRFQIPKTTIILQGLINRLDEIDQGVIEGPKVSDRKAA